MSSGDKARLLSFVVLPVKLLDVTIISMAADEGVPKRVIMAFFLFTRYSWQSFTFSHSACH